MFCLFPDCCFHSCFQTCSFNTTLKDYLSGCCFTCRALSLHLVFPLLLPAAVLSFVTHQPWIRNTDYMLAINETMENISYTIWAGSALCSFSYIPQRNVQSTKGFLGGGREQATVLPPHRLFDTMCNGRSESVAYWGITATSGWTTHK